MRPEYVDLRERLPDEIVLNIHLFLAEYFDELDHCRMLYSSDQMDEFLRQNPTHVDLRDIVRESPPPANVLVKIIADAEARIFRYHSLSTTYKQLDDEQFTSAWHYLHTSLEEHFEYTVQLDREKKAILKEMDNLRPLVNNTHLIRFMKSLSSFAEYIARSDEQTYCDQHG